MAEHVNTFMDWFPSFCFSQLTCTSNQSCVHDLLRRTGCSVGVWRGLHCCKPSSLSLLMVDPQDTCTNGLFISSRWVTARPGRLLGIGHVRAELISFLLCSFSWLELPSVLCTPMEKWSLKEVSMFCSRSCSPESKLYIQCWPQNILNCLKVINTDCCHMLFFNCLCLVYSNNLKIEKGRLKSSRV